jgi:hypothetical protein
MGYARLREIMTAKRIFLAVLTFVAIAAMGTNLIASWNQPQFQSRLQLSQTDLLLQASAFRGDQNTQRVLLDKNPEETALKSYQKSLESTEKAIQTAQQLTANDPEALESRTVNGELVQQETLRDELNLRIGILQAQQGKPQDAIKTWETIQDIPRSILDQKPVESFRRGEKTAIAATVLTELWGNTVPARAEPTLKATLDGWFEYRSLEKLYELQQRSDVIAQLRTTEQRTAQQALVKLAGMNGLPAIAIFLGLALLIFLIGQRFLKGKQSLLAGTNAISWSVPWDAEVVWQVLVVGFFFAGQILVGQFLLPGALAIAKGAFAINPVTWGVRGKAILALASYICLAAGGLGVLYWSIRSFLPLPPGWFRFSLKGKWFLWGLGGYLAAYPLVVAVSWVNDQIWQGRGGSNPMLSIALDSRDPIAIGIFLGTAAIAAPLFEETFFRGFLLPSLTRYFSTWQAILLSSVLFAVVHLSLSEVLPLTTLGILLAFVYTRTQNLMASVLLHALWNSGTLLTLFLLGNASA